MCFVSYDKQKDMELAENTTILDREFTLPDKTTIRLGAERFKAAECLFNP